MPSTLGEDPPLNESVDTYVQFHCKRKGQDAVNTRASGTRENDSLIISCLLAAALAAPPQLKLAPNEPIPILAQSNIVNEDGTFQNSYESADGTRAESSGSLKSLGPQEEGQVIQGSYSFYTPDGQLYELRYIADENGFQPQGNFLPVAPPIPEEILKSLAYNAAHPEEDNLRK
ncbi:unnamed protein product [Timema podura]|uniref:Larval cuticle protein LCP-17 n=1 Tax=Timema podura TaxID=61482 RepID=A0ABN7NRU6_TIMPD|nr:unnamed protein product [Timema podura]